MFNLKKYNDFVVLVLIGVITYVIINTFFTSDEVLDITTIDTGQQEETTQTEDLIMLLNNIENIMIDAAFTSTHTEFIDYSARRTDIIKGKRNPFISE